MGEGWVGAAPIADPEMYLVNYIRFIREHATGMGISYCK
jgi:hypothetical protein